MEIAIIVVACVLAAALIALFVTVRVMWHRTYQKAPADGEVRPKQKQTFKEWCINHKPSKRRLIQVYAALLYNANIKGYISGEIYQSETTKYMCVPGLNCYSCPGAIGACPLGAFQNALAETNKSAPYYMLGILALFGLIFARTVCGFLCPVGLGQDLLYKIRSPKLKKSRVTRVLSYLKYVLLAVLVIAIPLIYVFQNTPLPGFCKYICPAGTLGGAVMLLLNPNNADIYDGLGPLFTWKFCVLIAVATAAVFIYRVFCRFLCPLGAIYGFFNRIALLGIKVDKGNCTDCGLCVSHCKMDVKRVGDHECINCGECISVCPSKAIGWKGSKLFVHASAVAPPAEERPIAAMASAGAGVLTEPVEQPEQPPVSTVEAVEIETATAVAAPERAPVRRKKKSTKFWLELSAWVAATGLLAGALVYYNFIDAPKKYEVGQTVPDFTLELYGTDETFSMKEHRGEITILSFWNGADEYFEDYLHIFDEVSQTYAQWNVIAVSKTSDAMATQFVAEHGSEWSLTFAQDKAEKKKSSAYLTLGGNEKAVWNKMVIVNKKGKILYNGKMNYTKYEDVAALAGSGYNVGDTAPNFDLSVIGTTERYNLYENRGKVTIINFWATWCTSCKAELPYFDELAQNHSEWNVVAIHGVPSSGESPAEYIAGKYAESKIFFLQDNLIGRKCETYSRLGGTSMWPMTVIVDEEGTVIYNSAVSFHNYEDLEEAVLKAIG